MPLPSIVAALNFLILAIRVKEISIFKLLVKFTISSISSFDLYNGSPIKDGCTIKHKSLFLILIVLPSYMLL